MAAGDVAGDRKAETGPALVEIAGGVEPVERLEDRLVFLDRDAGTVVVDGDRQKPALMGAGDRDVVAVAAGVLDEVEKAALEPLRPDLDEGIAGKRYVRLVAG